MAKDVNIRLSLLKGIGHQATVEYIDDKGKWHSKRFMKEEDALKFAKKLKKVM
jgi:hypothetical protein